MFLTKPSFSYLLYTFDINSNTYIIIYRKWKKKKKKMKLAP